MLSGRGCWFSFLALVLWMPLLLGSMPVGAAEQDPNGTAAETKLSVNGYEGVLEKIEIPEAVLAIEKLEIGDPPFLNKLDSPEAYGILSCQGGVLQKGAAVVHLFRLQFPSEEKVIANLHLKRKPTPKRGPLMVEDPTNCRNSDFGLYFDGTHWSGFRSENGALALLKGAVSQEDFFRIMEKAI